MAFPLLIDAMLDTIRAYASEVAVPAGTMLYARGEQGADMFVVLRGSITIYTGNQENIDEIVTELGGHQFTGELNMLNDQPTRTL